MADYIVRQGDCFANIAAQHGIDIEELTGLGDNARYTRDGHSVHELLPGDTIEVPDDPPVRHARFRSGGHSNYVVDVPLIRFRTRLLDRANEPVAGKKYKLVVGARTYEGSTDQDGWVEQEIPATATEAVVLVWLQPTDKAPWRLELALGAMDPLADESGLVHRLANLGYATARYGKRGVQQALLQFQRVEGLPASGCLDAATEQRLQERHTG